MDRSFTLKLLGLLLALFAAACAGRAIRHLNGCNTRLGMPYKQEECRACVERPLPHEYLPDNADGFRCVRL